MTSVQSTLPSWLISANKSNKYVLGAIRALTSRESQRTDAREMSIFAAESGNEGSPPQEGYVATIDGDVPSDHIGHYSVLVGSQNRTSNRYSDVQPYDRTRVVVETLGDHTNQQPGRYLNASWVLERFGSKWWIATQAPLRHTAHAFLSIMLQSIIRPPLASNTIQTEELPRSSRTTRIRTVVQLTQNVEDGRKKADAYFPSEIGKTIIVSSEPGCDSPPLRVTLVSTKSIETAHCVQSTISVSPLRTSISPGQLRGSERNSDSDEDEYGTEEFDRIVFQHMLYTSWPDHGVPQPKDRETLLEFLRLVDETNRDKSCCPLHPSPTADHNCDELDPDPPIIVGCSAGIGRTGSFIALASLLRHYGFLPPTTLPTPATILSPSPLGPIPQEFKEDLVVQEIDFLREQRPGMVQRPEQILLVYQGLTDVFEKVK